MDQYILWKTGVAIVNSIKGLLVLRRDKDGNVLDAYLIEGTYGTQISRIHIAPSAFVTEPVPGLPLRVAAETLNWHAIRTKHTLGTMNISSEEAGKFLDNVLSENSTNMVILQLHTGEVLQYWFAAPYDDAGKNLLYMLLMATSHGHHCDSRCGKWLIENDRIHYHTDGTWHSTGISVPLCVPARNGDGYTDCVIYYENTDASVDVSTDITNLCKETVASYIACLQTSRKES